MVLILFLIHIEYKRILKFLKFSQSLFELDLLFFLINAIKEIITNEDNKNELSKLYSEIQTLQKRLSNLIDLKLDNIENKDVYNEKEKEIYNKIKMLNEQIEQLEYNDKQNKDISKRLKDIEKIINEEEQPMEIFDDVKFENLVEKIIIGKKIEMVILILIL